MALKKRGRVCHREHREEKVEGVEGEKESPFSPFLCFFSVISVLTVANSSVHQPVPCFRPKGKAGSLKQPQDLLCPIGSKQGTDYFFDNHNHHQHTKAGYKPALLEEKTLTPALSHEWEREEVFLLFGRFLNTGLHAIQKRVLLKKTVREGFEPTDPFQGHSISSRAPSTAQPPHQWDKRSVVRVKNRPVNGHWLPRRSNKHTRRGCGMMQAYG